MKKIVSMVFKRMKINLICVVLLLLIPFVGLADSNEAREELNAMNIELSYNEFFNQIREGNSKAVKLFIASGFDVNHKNSKFETPLKIAIEKRYNKILSLLLINGANVNTGSYTPLMAATDIGNIEAVKLLIKKAKNINVNDTGIQNETALHHACRNGQYEIAVQLINAGAFLNWPNDHGITPLIEAIINNDIKMITLLIHHNVDVNARDLREGFPGQSPLMYAASYGRIDIAICLIKHGADISLRTKNGKAALDYAIDTQDEKIIKFFQQFSTDEEIENAQFEYKEKIDELKTAVIQIDASSFLPKYKGIEYNADKISDYTLSTAWIEGKQDYGIGEYVEFKYDFRNLNKENYKANKVVIYNGYCKSKESWEKNSRVKRLRVYYDGKPHSILNLKDTKDMQLIEIPDILFESKTLHVIKFEIVDVYKGLEYSDTAISELHLMKN